MELKYFIIYLMIINLISFIAAALDKFFASKGLWRISEKALFLLSGIGGAGFMLLSMHIFRHKIKHKRFMIGLPVILIVQLIIISFMIKCGIFY